MCINSKRIIRAKQFIAEITSLFHFCDLLLKESGQFPELSTQIDIRNIGTHCIGSDGNPFEELERITLHDLAIFERARLRFIGIGDHIMRPILAINEGPFHASWEARTSAAAQARVLDYIGHFGRLHLRDRTLEYGKPTILFISIFFMKIRDLAVAKEDMFHYFTSCLIS